MKAGHSCEPKICGIEGHLFALFAHWAPLPREPVPSAPMHDKQNPLDQLNLTPSI